jgi:ribosomal protein S18 acetylase RimI-like enzyme
MIIKKPFRRQGHAYDFISRLVKHVSQMNQIMNPEFILYVDRENLPAYNLYLKLGFLVEDEFQNFVSND